MKEPFFTLNNMTHCIEKTFIAISSIITLQAVVVVYWSYSILSGHSVQELQQLTLTEWHDGLITVWTQSIRVTLKVILAVAIYSLIKLSIKSQRTATSTEIILLPKVDK
ncbi:MAG: hypothetical protein ACRCWR_10995 [Saezia sp.]